MHAGEANPCLCVGLSKPGFFPNRLYLRPASPLAGTHSEPNVKHLSCGRWAALAFLHDPQDEANQARYHTRAWFTQREPSGGVSVEEEDIYYQSRSGFSPVSIYIL